MEEVVRNLIEKTIEECIEERVWKNSPRSLLEDNETKATQFKDIVAELPFRIHLDEDSQNATPYEHYSTLLHHMGKHSKHLAWQISVLMQKDRVTCGYYALYFVLKVLRALQSKRLQDLFRNPSDLLCRSRFLWHEFRWHQVLEQAALRKNRDYFPWNLESIQSGVLEREYCNYLLKHDILLHQVGGADRILCLPEISEQCIACGFVSVDKVKQFHHVVTRFQEREEYFHGFLIGSHDHWVSMVVQKYQSSIQAFYLDSFNNPILTKNSESLLVELVDATLHNRKVAQELQEEKRTRYLGSYRAALYGVELILDCLAGFTTLAQLYCSLQTKSILQSYYNWMSDSLDNPPTPVSVELQNLWVENHHPAGVLCLWLENMSQVLEGQPLDLTSHTSLTTWMQDFSKHSTCRDLQANTEPCDENENSPSPSFQVISRVYPLVNSLLQINPS
jgi:hypothetical protein